MYSELSFSAPFLSPSGPDSECKEQRHFCNLPVTQAWHYERVTDSLHCGARRTQRVSHRTTQPHPTDSEQSGAGMAVACIKAVYPPRVVRPFLPAVSMPRPTKHLWDFHFTLQRKRLCSAQPTCLILCLLAGFVLEETLNKSKRTYGTTNINTALKIWREGTDQQSGSACKEQTKVFQWLIFTLVWNVLGPLKAPVANMSSFPIA